MKIKALKSLSAILGIIIAAAALLSGFSITAFAETEMPSDVKFSVTIDNSGAEDPIEDVESVFFHYPYVYTTEVGDKGYRYRSEECKITQDPEKPNSYWFDGTLSEKINSLASDKKLDCYIYFYIGGRYIQSNTIEYKSSSDRMNFKVVNKTMTPDWEAGSIYNLGKPSSGYCSRVCNNGKIEPERYRSTIYLYVGGGKVPTPGGGAKDTKSVQLALMETFAGSSYDNTASKEIKWIVTTDETCPTSFKQKSDTSVCKVSKGKVTAVDEGDAYVWACRVDPNDKEKVSVDESCCIRICVENAPAKIEITDTSANDAKKISGIDLNVGESKKVYLKITSRIENGWLRKECDFKVTKGSEYISVTEGYDNFTVTALPVVLKDNKPVKAEVTVTSRYNTKKAKLKVTVSNGVVDFHEHEDHPYTIKPLQIIMSDQKQTVTISKDTLENCAVTSAEKHFHDYEDTTLRDMPMTDKPKVFVTTATTVTDSMVYKTGKKTTIKFSGTKSPSVSASYKDGAVTLKVKKGAAEEKGNVIIVYNTEKYLAIPYTISKTAPAESGTETPQS